MQMQLLQEKWYMKQSVLPVMEFQAKVMDQQVVP